MVVASFLEAYLVGLAFLVVLFLEHLEDQNLGEASYLVHLVASQADLYHPSEACQVVLFRFRPLVAYLGVLCHLLEAYQEVVLPYLVAALQIEVVDLILVVDLIPVASLVDLYQEAFPSLVVDLPFLAGLIPEAVASLILVAVAYQVLEAAGLILVEGFLLKKFVNIHEIVLTIWRLRILVL